MLWDPGSTGNEEGEGHDNVPVTPILVPLHNKPPSAGKSVPVSVPDVQELKDQFQQQQNMLTQIKETLKQNESQLNSKEKQVEAYANRLSQIRARTKNTQGKKPINPISPKMQKKLSKENLTKVEDGEKAPGTSPKNRKVKMSELKRCLEENKIKFEQRTGKEQSETRKIESLVEQLKTQLEERDKTIQDLQKTIEHPAPKSEVIPKKKQKSDKDSVASKTTQTKLTQPSEDSIEIITLKNKIYELEANVLDLEENIKEKESVIEARTQAVTLLSQDLSLKGKNTLESLEETRQEMRAMQSNFILIEDQFKKDLLDRDNRLAILEEKCKKLESANFELSVKNAEQQEKLVHYQTKYLEVEAEKKSLTESMVQGQTDDKLEELMKKINVLTKELDDRNKAMIKMKIEHKNKIKNLNKTLDTLKGASDEKAEIIRLSNLVEEFENIKMALENRVAELEDEKAVEKKLKDKINELELIIQKQREDICLHLKTVSNLEKDNYELIQSNQDQNIVIENLHAKIQEMEIESEAKLRDVTQKMEAEYNKMKTDKRKEAGNSEINPKGDLIDRKELEEYLISAEISNIHVEEQIELLIREKQVLLEKLKSLSGVSSTDSLTFEKMEHSELRDEKETFSLGEDIDPGATSSSENRTFHLEKIVHNQQRLINDLQKTIKEEKDKMQTYQLKIADLEGVIKQLEDVNTSLKHQIEMSEIGESDKNTKSNTDTKNRIKKIEMELTESKRVIQEQSEKLQELNKKLVEKEELIKNYTEKIELFEKDDWDRQNHWKNTEDECGNFQELQKKCLSLENSLIELNEDCERLRKENIEIVHLLSEEKVKRRQLLEQLETKVEVKDAETQKGRPDKTIQERLEKINALIRALEEKVEKLEKSQNLPKGQDKQKKEEMAELQERLEWTIVVLTSKETEIFKLQNMLEDRSKSIEILESDLRECKLKLEEKEIRLSEITEELKAKEMQPKKISDDLDKLRESMNAANVGSAINEIQLAEVLMNVVRIEEILYAKESEWQEIKGILCEKNFDMTNLRDKLDKLNQDLTHSSRLENMNKCIADKEAECDALLADKNRLEDLNRSLATEAENIQKLNAKITEEKDKLADILLHKENLIAQLNEKLKTADKPPEGEKNKNQEMEDMKIKMKKLAANLKKKAQNEIELQKQVKELEKEVTEVAEKWTIEKSEKEALQGALLNALEKNNNLESESASMRATLADLEKETQVLRETSRELEMIGKEDKDKTAKLESQLAELSQLYQNVLVKLQSQEENKEKEIILQKLAETTGKFEQVKFKYDQLLIEKADLEKCIEELKRAFEEGASENSRMKAKVQENLAVIESLGAELEKARNKIKSVEERFFHSEERRLSLENKNEEMCRKIMEDSENLVTIDDLSIRVDELLKSEKLLQDYVKNLETGNGELKQMLDEVQNEKYSLENDLKISVEKLAEAGKELKELKDSESEKNNIIRELTKEVERLKSENRQLSSEFEKLNRDYEQFEVDFKENFENSQNVERTLRHKIEELTNENAALAERCNVVSEGKGEEEDEDKKQKKRKSVTFRTDEVEYIKDLKRMLHNYDDSLKQANEEIENLKAELFKERLRHEVSNVVAQAEEKVESLRSTPEKKSEPTIERLGETVFQSSGEERKFDANTFFGNETGPDSLMWDDGWGAEGQLEVDYLSKIGNEERLKTLEAENEKLSKDVQDVTSKYAKAIKKLKELKTAYDKLHSERKENFCDLDTAIVDELKAQIEDKETKEKELMKSLESAKLEKENLLKRIEMLNVGNEKFLEMKERQDNEVEMWQKKNNELLKEIAELRQKSVEPHFVDESALGEEVKELKNKIEALEWKNCELNELLEEKQEQLENQIEDKKIFDEKRVDELNEKINALVVENEMLQSILSEMKTKPTLNMTEQNQKQEEIERLLELQKQREQSIIELEDLIKLRDGETQSLRQVIQSLEISLHQKEEELEKLSGVILIAHKDLEELRQKEKDRFETISLDQSPSDDALRSYIVELESLLSQREDELQQVHQSRLNDIEELRQKIFSLEDTLRIKEEELSRIQADLPAESNTRTDVETLKIRILELEEQLKNQKAGVKESEKNKEGFFNWSLVTKKECNTEQELQERLNEIENLKQKIVLLEDTLRVKDDELARLSNISFYQGNLAGEIENVVDVDKEGMRLKIIQLEDSLRLRDEELMKLQPENSTWAVEPLQQKQEAPSLQSFFDWGVVTEESKHNAEIQQELENKKRETENLKHRIVQLENQQEEVESLRRKIVELEHQQNRRESPRRNDVVEQTEQKKGIQPLSSLFNWGLVTGSEPTHNKNETEHLTQRIAQLEDTLRIKDEELEKWQSTSAKEFEHQSSLSQRIIQLENQLKSREDELTKLKSEIGVNIPNQKIEEVEYACKVDSLTHLAESNSASLKQPESQSEQTENILNWNQVTGDRSSDQFDLCNWSAGNNTNQVQKIDEVANYKQRIDHLEELLRLREDELAKWQSGQTVGNESNELMRRVYQLEELLRLKDEELKRLQPSKWEPELEKLSEVENLKVKITQLENCLEQRETQPADWRWNKENNWEHTTEVKVLQQSLEKLQISYQIKANEVETLRGRLTQLENELTMIQSWPQGSQKEYDFENALRYKEEEINHLRGRITELENMVPLKDEEITRLMARLNELEKSYNDSKLEIERLLNEEKLNTEEKFVEPFQKNMKIPVAFELEALSRTLKEEKQKSENLKYELCDKDNLLTAKNEEIKNLNSDLTNMQTKLQEEHQQREELLKMKMQLEKVISELQKNVENSNLQLSIAREELQQFQSVKDEAMNNLKQQMLDLENKMLEAKERERIEMEELRKELMEKTKYYKEMIKERKEEEEKMREAVKELEGEKVKLEKEVEVLKIMLEDKENNMESLGKMLTEEKNQVVQMRELLELREGEVADLKETLTHLQEEIGHFRNFEKQVKELRVAQLKEANSEVSVTSEGQPDLSDWPEHELAELSARLQSDLDTALYMLHQRDVRCDELTFELMQLLEERDTLQLRLSTALRINEELKALTKGEVTRSGNSLKESKDLVDQSNDRQTGIRVPSEDFRQLASKISELHSVSYLKDKTVKDDSVQRHKEQMTLLSRVSDSEITLSRDVQSSPAVLLNWVRGKTTPKVMHI